MLHTTTTPLVPGVSLDHRQALAVIHQQHWNYGVLQPSFTALIFRLKECSVIACWSVRTLCDKGTQVFTMCTLLAFRVDVACPSEARIPGSGHTPISIPQQDVTSHIYHSGTADNTSRHCALQNCH